MKSIILVLDQKTDDIIYMEDRMKCGMEHSGHKDNCEQKQRNGKVWGTDMRKKTPENKNLKKCTFLSLELKPGLGFQAFRKNKYTLLGLLRSEYSCSGFPLSIAM